MSPEPNSHEVTYIQYLKSVVVVEQVESGLLILPIEPIKSFSIFFLGGGGGGLWVMFKVKITACYLIWFYFYLKMLHYHTNSAIKNNRLQPETRNHNLHTYT